MPFLSKLNGLGDGGQTKIVYEGLEHFIFYLLRKVLRKKNGVILSKLETETDGKKNGI